MSKRSRRGYRPAVNPNTRILREQTAQRRRELATNAAVQLANQRAVRAMRLAQGTAEAAEVIAERPEPTVDDLLMLSRQALDKAGELLGIQSANAPAGAHANAPETEAPRGDRQQE